MDKRKIDIISILAIIIACVLFYTAFLGKDFATFRSLRQDRYSIKGEINNDKYTLEILRNKKSEAINLESEITKHRLVYLKKDNVPYFLNYVSSLANRDNVMILLIEPGETVSEDIFTKTSYTAELKGGFSNIYDFLYHLEDDWRGVKIESMSLDKNTDDNSMNLRLLLSVYTINGDGEKI